MDNLEERDKFLGSDNLQRMNQEEIDIINRSITRPKIENVVKDLPTKKRPGPDDSAGEFYLIFRVNAYLLKLFQKVAEKRILPSSFYEVIITLIPKPVKIPQKRENFRPVSLMNVEANLLNKIQANQIQRYFKRIMHHDQKELENL